MNQCGIDGLVRKLLDKNEVKEAFESLRISFQEEATTKWNGESERRIWANAHNQVVEKMKELGISDEE